MLRSHTMKSLKALHMCLFISLYSSHCTEMLQWHCYNNDSDHFSCSDCNDFIVCDHSLMLCVSDLFLNKSCRSHSKHWVKILFCLWFIFFNKKETEKTKYSIFQKNNMLGNILPGSKNNRCFFDFLLNVHN